jgi:hypothetical protein
VRLSGEVDAGVEGVGVVGFLFGLLLATVPLLAESALAAVEFSFAGCSGDRMYDADVFSEHVRVEVIERWKSSTARSTMR